MKNQLNTTKTYIFLFISTFSIVFYFNCKQNNVAESTTITTKLSANSVQAQLQTSTDILHFKDDNLQHQLEAVIAKNATWNRLVKNQKMAIGLLNLNPNGMPKYASINGNHMMYAASLPKIVVLLAAEDALEKGEIEDSSTLQSDLRLMISKSNNKATTRIIDLVGFKKIEDVVTEAKNKFYDINNGGGLWVGKRYAAGGKTNKDPLKNLSHAANVDNVTKFYYMLYTKQLISEERSNHMLKMLEDPELSHKFVYALQRIAPNAKVYRKSGSWKNWHADSAMVINQDKQYIMVALLEDSNGEQIIRNLVEPLSRLIP